MNMSVDQEFSNPSFVRYEINGSQFIVQSLENAQETVGRIIENENDERVVKIVDTTTVESDEDESIPLVCVDGQIYAIHNGELQVLDMSQMEYENDENCNDGKKVVEFGKDKVSGEGDCIEITRYESDSDPPLSQETDEMEMQSDDSRQLYVVAKNNISTSDFAEIVTALKCKACPYTTQSKGELMKHFRKFHANPIAKVQEETANSEEVKLLYMCGECSNCFPSMDACREHMIKDHQLMVRKDTKKSEQMTSESPKITSQPSFKPTILGARRSKSPVKENSVTTKTRSSQRDKKSLDLKDRQVKCTYRGCPHKFSTDITMQQHAICHIDVPYYANIFKCSICRDEKFTKWKPCSLHLWKKHEIDVDLFSCNTCKAYKSATMVKLLTHMRVHSDNREFECPDCGKCFKQSSQLRNHRVMHLDRKTTNVPRWYTSKTCDLCGKIYADSKCLKNHIQAVHSKLRPYVCNVCGHSSARKAMLQMHLRQHTGDKPFNCELCDYKTGDHNSLRRHMMRHTGVRPYKCPHCPYSAIQSNSYKNHLRVKHPLLSGLFTCELCPFKTVKNESYLQHIGDHEKGLIKTPAPKKDGENVEVFPGNIAAAQLIYSCLGAFSKVGKTIEASLMSSSTSADGTSQTITIQIPSKHLEGSLPTSESSAKNIPSIEQEDDETMHCFLKIPREEEENIDTGGITIPAEPEDDIVVDS